MMRLLNDRLPFLLPFLSVLAKTLAVESNEEAGRALRVQVEQWINDLSQYLLTRTSSSLSNAQLLEVFRQAPSPMLLDAFIAQQEALRTLAEREYHAALGGMPAEEADFWNVGGDGFTSLEMGKAALASTWWPFRQALNEWITMQAPALQQTFEQIATVLAPGRLAQLATSIAEDLHREALLSSNLPENQTPNTGSGDGLERLETRAFERFDDWIKTRTLDQRKDHRSLHAQMLTIAQSLVPDLLEEEYDDAVVREILGYALDTTSLAINQPEDIEEQIRDYWSNASHLRPITQIASNLVQKLLQSLREYWRQHELNPYQERLS